MRLLDMQLFSGNIRLPHGAQGFCGLPQEKLGLSLPALDIFESRLYKDFQI